jgi:hypothetical protein
MVDRVGRDVLAEALRQLIAGTITNLEYEDRAHLSLNGRKERVAQEDPALWAVFSRAWFLYTDIREQRLRGKEAIPRNVRRKLATWVVFLKSDVEYRWPIKSFISFTGCILRVLTLGLAGFFIRSRFDRVGDSTIWPFWTREELADALARPVYLAGRRAR